MNPNWVRWIHASLAIHFKNIIESQGHLKLHIEGQDRTVTNLEDHAELRWDGPYIREVSRRYWHIDIEINIIVSSVLSRDDTHIHKKSVGLVQSAFPNTILVHKHGDGAGDNANELLGCFQLRTEDREAVVTSYFGKIEVDVLLEQSTVEAHYRMTLSA